MNQTFKSSQSSTNSISFIFGTTLFTIFLIAVFILQKKTELPELIGKKTYITGMICCGLALAAEIWIMRSNKKQYEKKAG